MAKIAGLQDLRGIGKEYPINRLAGITPVAATWDVNPTNLARCGDGAWNVATGVGTKTFAAAGGIYGDLLWDMGDIYNIIFCAKLMIGNTIGGGATQYVQLLSSDDNITYYVNLAFHWQTGRTSLANADEIFFCTAFLRGRYIKVNWVCDATTGVVRGAVYETVGYDLGTRVIR